MTGEELDYHRDRRAGFLAVMVVKSTGETFEVVHYGYNTTLGMEVVYGYVQAASGPLYTVYLREDLQ